MEAIAYDTETTGLRRHEGAEMFAFSTCDWGGESEAYRLDGKARRASQRKLDELWSDDGMKRYAKVMHNARFDLGMTEKRLGRSMRGHEIHETMALSHIFQNTHPNHRLAELAWELFRYPMDRDDLTKHYKHSENGLRDCPPDVLYPYQLADAERTMLLLRFWLPKLKENGWEEVYDMERRLAWTTLAIEDRGFMLDQDRCGQLQDWCRVKAQEAREAFQAAAGEMLNPGSDKQLRWLLFEKLKLPVVALTKKAAQPSTDKEAIEELERQTKHPVLDLILRYRAYKKGAALLQGYLDLADEDGILHANIHPYKARTGRESITQPALQVVSKDTTLRTRYPIPARRVFRPRPGYVNLHGDYAGIEYRLLVDLSNDPKLIDMILRGEDGHDNAAGMFYGDRFKRATGKARKGLRDTAKNGNFCLGFGGGIGTLAKTLGLTVNETKPGYDEYKRQHPAFIEMSRRVIADVRATGHVSTRFNRRLYIPRMKPYAGVNYWVQGSAAGILKRAQNRVDQYLLDATGGEAGIVLPIHDEIVVEFPRSMMRDLPEHARNIRDLMVDFPQFKVPLKVDFELSTRDWNTTHDFDPDKGKA